MSGTLKTIRSMKKEIRETEARLCKQLQEAISGVHPEGKHYSVHFLMELKRRNEREAERYADMERRYSVPECDYCKKHGSGACVACGCDADHVCFNNQ